MHSRKALKVVDSRGDYHEDATLLEDKSMPLFSAQETLPRLPVPSLFETCERFLPTALPLAKTPQETESLIQAVQRFPKQAQKLQKRLLEHSNKNSNTSWLSLWWNQMGYLQVRDPIVVHVSYFFRCNDDPKLEDLMDAATTINTTTANPPPPYQPCIARSAALLPAAIQYAQSLRTNQVPPATIGKDGKIVLCSAQCKYMFHACRIPQKMQDKYRLYFPSQEHIVIACRGQFFAVDINDGNSDGDGTTMISQKQWRRVLQYCVDQTSLENNKNLPPPSVGFLSAMNRDDWAEAREILLEQGGSAMAEALESLESSMFLLCMDIDEEIRTDRDRALQFWHGSSDTSKLYHNRYYDKSAQILVTQSGKLGFQGEHSMMDGMPFVDFCDAMVNQGTVEEDCLESSGSGKEAMPKITNIFETAFAALSPGARAEIDKCLDKAKSEFVSLVHDYDLHAQHYKNYGSTVMKKAGMSPDAFTQMAMQLASYRMFGEPLATYESTQVRKFLHGRTETTRTVSPDSLAFCQAMSDGSILSKEEKLALLQTACSSHVQYIRQAVEGRGVDRHLFGLSMCVQDGEHPPDLFSHPLYEKAKRFRLSTSSLPNMAVGFGPVCDDGFGIGYEAKPNSCIFHVTARTEHKGWTEQLCMELARALDDMFDLCDNVEARKDSKPPRSRL